MIRRQSIWKRDVAVSLMQLAFVDFCHTAHLQSVFRCPLLFPLIKVVNAAGALRRHAGSLTPMQCWKEVRSTSTSLTWASRVVGYAIITAVDCLQRVLYRRHGSEVYKLPSLGINKWLLLKHYKVLFAFYESVSSSYGTWITISVSPSPR